MFKKFFAIDSVEKLIKFILKPNHAFIFTSVFKFIKWFYLIIKIIIFLKSLKNTLFV